MIPLLASLIPLAGQMLGGMFGGGAEGGKGGGGEGGKGGGGDAPAKLTGGDIAAIIGASKGGSATPTAEGGYTQLPPKQQQALDFLSTQQALAPIKDAQSTEARQTVERIKAEILPELQRIKQATQLQQTQTDATAEHRNIVAQQQFRDKVERALTKLQTTLDRHDAEVKAAKAERERRRIARLEQIAARAGHSVGMTDLPGFRF